MLIDVHLHTTLSGDSFIAPEEIAGCARDAGLDGLCITDHNKQLTSDWHKTIQESTDLLVIPGAEIWTNIGEILVYGITDEGFWDRVYNMPWAKVQPLINEINSLGGAVIAPHPFRKSGGLGQAIFELQGLAALELNANDEPYQHEAVFEASEKLGLPLVGGSDAHQHKDVGRFSTVFYNNIKTTDEFIRILKSGEGFAPQYR